MKVYRLSRSIVITGKAWQIRYLLKEYARRYPLVKDWLADR
ncbi:Z-ring formation inhibitor MciZ [Bacillus lacus]|uniref:Z-ring formation inhibitor MciZ n=1 Tax=Metabacillus lacus TaxID=1983721 RepID=A0A7X2M170_9BACI|nr:Z-ring formation inhibitor MciZ [Metabacillus lacus]MRX74317.1 Z-ring formation inhibitor MciZ [Metabacillus lacus]